MSARPLITALFVFGMLAGCTSRADVLRDTEPHLRYDAEVSAETLLAPGPDPASDEAGPLVGLAAMIEHQLTHAPSLQAARERYLAAVERVPGATRLPNLKVAYTWLPLPVETRTGPNVHRVMVEQAIPFPSKLVARDAGARADARLAAVRYDAAVRDAVTSLKVAYADLHYYERALAVLETNQALAETLAQLGATRNAEGVGVLFEVARAQSQLAQLTYDRITLEERRDISRADVNALLGRSADAPLEVEPLPAIEVDVDETALVQLALAHRQELRMLDESVRRAEARLDLAESGWAPDLMLGAQLMLQDESEMTPAPADSGDPALGVTVGLSLPVWAWGQAADTAAAEAELVAALHDKDAELHQVAAAVRRARFDVANAERLRILYDEELLPNAVAALETAELVAEADGGRYADLLEAQAAYYSFALARERALADQVQAIARLEQVIGASLHTGASDADGEGAQ